VLYWASCDNPAYPRIQATVLEVCREWEPRLRESWRRATERGIAALVKTGTRILPVSDAELATFTEVSARSRTEYAARAGLSEILSKIADSSKTR
jgi:TRAP-type C4-dicarboxylate transport system substrate-binding protein